MGPSAVIQQTRLLMSDHQWTYLTLDYGATDNTIQYNIRLLYKFIHHEGSPVHAKIQIQKDR